MRTVCRISEGYGCNKSSNNIVYPTFITSHTNGPVIMSLSHCMQFTHCLKKDCFVSVSTGDNCFEINGKIGLVRNIFEERSNDNTFCHVMFEEFASVNTFFDDPLDSGHLRLYCVEKMTGFCKVYSLNDVKSKYVILPHKQGYVVMPQLHYYHHWANCIVSNNYRE